MEKRLKESFNTNRILLCPLNIRDTKIRNTTFSVMSENGYLLTRAGLDLIVQMLIETKETYDFMKLSEEDILELNSKKHSETMEILKSNV